jgi:hypothetical protein
MLASFGGLLVSVLITVGTAVVVGYSSSASIVVRGCGARRQRAPANGLRPLRAQINAVGSLVLFGTRLSPAVAFSAMLVIISLGDYGWARPPQRRGRGWLADGRTNERAAIRMR